MLGSFIHFSHERIGQKSRCRFLRLADVAQPCDTSATDDELADSAWWQQLCVIWRADVSGVSVQVFCGKISASAQGQSEFWRERGEAAGGLPERDTYCQWSLLPLGVRLGCTDRQL